MLRRDARLFARGAAISVAVGVTLLVAGASARVWGVLLAGGVLFLVIGLSLNRR
jgi:hypothetical protein